VPADILSALALQLGADVPMCLESRPLIARGIGEEIERVALPRLFLVLANPLKGVSTPQIFRELAQKNNRPLDLSSGDWMRVIGANRNDLEPPARSLAPEIAEIAALLAESGADIVRMSGSGATCFGLFPSLQAAEVAARQLHSQRPDWYFQATETVSGE